MSDDYFGTVAPTVMGPAIGCYAVTPNDGADLTDPIRMLTIGVSGTISFVSSRNGRTYTSGELTPGSYPLFASRILSTGTTATGLTGWI